MLPIKIKLTHPNSKFPVKTHETDAAFDVFALGFKYNTVISELIRVTKKYVFYNIQMVTGNKVALFKLIGHFAEYLKEVDPKFNYVAVDASHGVYAFAEKPQFKSRGVWQDGGESEYLHEINFGKMLWERPKN